MNIDDRRILLIDLISKLNAVDSWSGETHIQKGVYFFTNLFHIDLNLLFVLYKYGPYSFDLKSELSYLEYCQILSREDTGQYGSHYSLGKYAPAFRSLVSGETAPFAPNLDWIIEKIFKTHSKVSELEKDSTALYALINFSGEIEEMAKRITEIKPHITRAEALKSIQSMQELRVAAENSLESR